MTRYIGLTKSIQFAKKKPAGYYVEWFAKKTKRGYEIDTSRYIPYGATSPKTFEDFAGWEYISVLMQEHSERVFNVKNRLPSLTERVKAACEQVWGE